VDFSEITHNPRASIPGEIARHPTITGPNSKLVIAFHSTRAIVESLAGKHRFHFDRTHFKEGNSRLRCSVTRKALKWHLKKTGGRRIQLILAAALADVKKIVYVFVIGHEL
jgi:hypothetical protein